MAENDRHLKNSCNWFSINIYRFFLSHSYQIQFKHPISQILVLLFERTERENVGAMRYQYYKLFNRLSSARASNLISILKL